jgi:activator of HSP90 ATPase
MTAAMREMLEMEWKLGSWERTKWAEAKIMMK